MAFKLLSREEARAFGMQIINAYLQGHDLPIVGAGVKFPIEEKRVKNKTRQSVYKAKTPRLTIWLTPDYDSVTSGLVEKISAISTTKKQYREALGTLHRHQRELHGFQTRTISHVTSTTNTPARIQARIAFRDRAIVRLNASIALDNIDVSAKFTIYNNARNA